MAKRQPAQPQRKAKRPPPEKTFSVGHVGVAVWLNTVDGDDGPRTFRNVTIAPKRYRDRESGEWKNSSSYNPDDMPALIYCMQQALEYTFTQPVPNTDGEEASSEEGDSEVPF